jgi:hypothetical protein
MANGRDDGGRPISKADFVWLMVELGRVNRAAFRDVRAQGWQAVARSAARKSDNPN